MVPVSLPLTRYRFTAAFERELQLPDYAGSLLRGVFGAALRRTACTTGLPDCRACPLWRSCSYPALFETPPRQTQLAQRFSQVPNPYVIEPPDAGLRRLPAGQPLVWHMVLFGTETLRKLPQVVQAWQRSLREGWGEEPGRTMGKLLGVEAVEASGARVPAWDVTFDCALAHAAQWTHASRAPAQAVAHAPSTSPSRATLHLHTPLRLQNEGHPLSVAELSPRVMVAHLLRRTRLMLELHLGVSAAPFDVPSLLSHAETLQDDRTELRWKDWTRYSSRQKQEMTLGGVIGRWSLDGDLAPLLPWLDLGQWLHLGKNATMGMGGYTLESGHSANRA